MDIQKVLKDLCLSYGVSGNEEQSSDIAFDYLKQFAKDVHIDSFNNVIGVISEAKENKPNI